MLGLRKRFDPELKQANDGPAVAAVLAYLEEQGVPRAVQNPDLYGPDIVLWRGLRPTSYIEVEIKRVWREGTEFPWRTLQLPERKGKFRRLGLPIEYWILRADRLQALVIPEAALDDPSSSLVEVPNRLVAGGEYFYQIPVNLCSTIHLEDTAYGN